MEPRRGRQRPTDDPVPPPRSRAPSDPATPRRSAGSPPQRQQQVPRRSHSSPLASGAPGDAVPRRSAATPPEAPLPRRSATTPPEIPAPAAGSRVRRQADSAWLASLAVPLVVLFSVTLGLGISLLVNPADTPAPVATASGDSITPAASPEPSALREESTPPPSPTVAPGQQVELNDARLTVPESWSITSDELVEGDRRAIRLREPGTDARLQAVTLEASGQTPRQACQALVDLQRQAYTGVTTHLTLALSVPDGAGEGITCGFEGTRESDGVPNVVSFTLLHREVDGHMLMLRATVPESVPASAGARSQLVAMQCEASRTFGVRLPLC